MSLLLSIFVGIAVTFGLEFIFVSNKKFKNTFWDHPVTIYGYKIHHSTYGLLFIALGLIFSGLRIFLIGLGLGVIIAHTISDKRFVFVEKRT